MPRILRVYRNRRDSAVYAVVQTENDFRVLEWVPLTGSTTELHRFENTGDLFPRQLAIEAAHAAAEG